MATRAGTEPAHGLLDQGPNGIPPAPIMTDLNYTGTLVGTELSRGFLIQNTSSNRVPIGASWDPIRIEIRQRRSRDGRNTEGVRVRCRITAVTSDRRSPPALSALDTRSEPSAPPCLRPAHDTIAAPSITMTDDETA